MKRTPIYRCVAIAIVVFPLLLAGGYRAASQRNTSPAANKELPLHELLKPPGKLIGEAKSARSAGNLKLTGYRVEELQLCSRSLPRRALLWRRYRTPARPDRW